MHISKISCEEITFFYEENQPLLTNVSCSVKQKRIGLIGANGSGKSTLLKLFAGEITPNSGSVLTGSRPYYMPQYNSPLDNRNVAEFLGIDDYLVAYRNLKNGQASSDDYLVLEKDWSLIGKIDKLCSKWFPLLSWDTFLTSISGGECTSLGLAYVDLWKPNISLLDEPSNNLDSFQRRHLIDLVTAYPHTLLIATHDRELLRYVDGIWELRNGRITTVDGSFSDYLALSEMRRSKQESRILNASQEVKRLNQSVYDLEKRQAASRRNGRNATLKKRGSKMSMNGLKGRSQSNLSSKKSNLLKRKKNAENELQNARSAFEADNVIRLEGFLEKPEFLPKQLLRLSDKAGWSTILGGNDRVALLGINGIGKSTLINSIFSDSARLRARASAQLINCDKDSVGVLEQNSSDLSFESTVFKELTSAITSYSKQEICALLARLAFNTERLDDLVSSLSGGERFRLSLAKVILAKPQKKLIILDEPTNSLDIDSLTAIEMMLNQFPGALLVVSHDISFLRNISINRWIELNNAGLTELVTAPYA